MAAAVWWIGLESSSNTALIRRASASMMVHSFDFGLSPPSSDSRLARASISAACSDSSGVRPLDSLNALASAKLQRNFFPEYSATSSATFRSVRRADISARFASSITITPELSRTMS